MKLTVALLALLTFSLSAGQVSASAADLVDYGSATDGGYQAAAHHHHHHHGHHRRHHKLEDTRGDVRLELSALV
jgi:hypothetical protein